jgi:hypothetical protein
MSSLPERLAAHPDPIVRELAGELRAGRLRPRDVLRHPRYAPALRRASEHLRTLDPARLRAEVERHLAEHRHAHHHERDVSSDG